MKNNPDVETLIHISLFQICEPCCLGFRELCIKSFVSTGRSQSLESKFTTFSTLNCSVAWCERSDHWQAVTTTRQDSEAENAGRERERDALHPQENDEPGSPWSSPARDDAGHPEGLERECGADLPHLQVPSNHKEPVPPPARPSGKGALQGQNSCRFANKETVSKEHSCLRRSPYF